MRALRALRAPGDAVGRLAAGSGAIWRLDSNTDWYVSGVPNPGWSNDDLHSLHQVPGSAFEVVDSSLLTEPLTGGAPVASPRR